MKQASKPVAAFDKLEKGGHELFNTGSGEANMIAWLHEIF